MLVRVHTHTSLYAMLMRARAHTHTHSLPVWNTVWGPYEWGSWVFCAQAVSVSDPWGMAGAPQVLRPCFQGLPLASVWAVVPAA